jgi:hypothetical protein
MMPSRGAPGGARALALALALSVLGAAPTSGQAPPVPAAPASMELRVEGESVTAVIRNTPVQSVLEELAARTGVQFEVATGWNPSLSLSLQGVPLGEAIQRCVASGDSIFYFGADAAGNRRIRVVRVFPKGLKGQPASLRVLGTGAPTKAGDDKIESVEQAIKVLAENPRVELRVKAVEMLGGAKVPAAAPALIPALQDKAVEVRAAAIEALAGIGSRRALGAILEALKDPSPAVRQSAVQAVALLGTGRNLRDLRPLLRDPEPGVAAAADLAVRRLVQRR